MPNILEMKVIDDELWCRVGKPGEFESGVSLWTPEEAEAKYRAGYYMGYDDAMAGNPRYT